MTRGGGQDNLDVMRTIVDGHNALHRLGIRTGDHAGDRRELLRRVREADPGAEVYFDARNAPPDLPAKLREEGVVVFYVRGEEADRAILDRVREATRPRDLLVVTDDAEVAGGARQLGARTRPVRDYFARAEEREEGPGEEGPGGFSPEDFGLPPQINLKHPPREYRDRG